MVRKNTELAWHQTCFWWKIPSTECVNDKQNRVIHAKCE